MSMADRMTLVSTKLGLRSATLLVSTFLCGAAHSTVAAEPVDWRYFDELIGKTFVSGSKGNATGKDVKFTTFSWLIPRSVVMAKVADARGEPIGAFVARGLQGRRFVVSVGGPNLVEGYAHPDGGAFTFLVSYADGLAPVTELLAGGDVTDWMSIVHRGFAKPFPAWRPSLAASLPAFVGSRMVADDAVESWRSSDWERATSGSQSKFDEAIASTVRRLLAFDVDPLPPADGSASQTPAGAQSFINLMASQGRYTVEAKWAEQEGWNQYEALDLTCTSSTFGLLKCTHLEGRTGRNVSVPAHRAIGADPVDGLCGTLIFASLPPVNEMISSKHMWTGGVVPPFLVNWGSVTEVEQEGVLVTVATPWPRPQFRFNVGSEAMAARLAFAMEFLRSHCDVTAGTGF